jgi:hypothetical protein
MLRAYAPPLSEPDGLFSSIRSPVDGVYSETEVFEIA